MSERSHDRNSPVRARKTFATMGAAIGRLGVLTGGEAAQSALHFGLGVVLIGLLPAPEYGVFTLALVYGGISLTYIRSLSGAPTLTYVGRSHSKRAACFYDGVFGAAGIALSTLAAATTYFSLPVASPDEAASAALFVGLWCARAQQRSSHFAFGHYSLVTAADIVFASSGALAALLAVERGEDKLRDVFLALSTANALGMAAMAVLAGALPRINVSRRARSFYLRLCRRLAWSALGVTTANLQGQAISLLVVVLAGVTAYAPIAAILVLFSPLRIFATAYANLVQPQVAKLVAEHALSRVWSLCLYRSAALVAVGVVFGAHLAVFLTFFWPPYFPGGPAHGVVLFAWAVYALSLVSTTPRVVLEAMLEFRAIAIITAAGAAAGMIAIAVILELASSNWALAGAALGEAVVLAASWITTRHLTRSPRAAARPAKECVLREDAA
ncbi:MAG: hypothetical protein ABSF67_14270 [Roseiarcus sp.]|jgi:O-antigen/teichoic acid export membrane protein